MEGDDASDIDDEKDYTEIIMDDDENDIGEENEGDGDCIENDEDEVYPLQPEVSFQETDEALAMGHPLSSGLEISSVQSMRASWNIPHSSTNNNNNHGTANRNSSLKMRQNFGNPAVTSQSSQQNSGKDGILLRMMREPLKSSTSSTYAHQQPYASQDP